jgi:hypothetical protein
VAKIILRCENTCECDDCRGFREQRREFYRTYIDRVHLQQNKGKRMDYEMELLRCLRAYSFAREYCCKVIDKLGAAFWSDSNYSIVYELIKTMVADGEEPNDLKMFEFYVEKHKLFFTLRALDGRDYVMELFVSIAFSYYEQTLDHLFDLATNRKMKKLNKR